MYFLSDELEESVRKYYQIHSQNATEINIELTDCAYIFKKISYITIWCLFSVELTLN